MLSFIGALTSAVRQRCLLTTEISVQYECKIVSKLFATARHIQGNIAYECCQKVTHESGVLFLMFPRTCQRNLPVKVKMLFLMLPGTLEKDADGKVAKNLFVN